MTVAGSLRIWTVLAIACALAAVAASLVDRSVVFDLRPDRYDLSVARFATGVQSVEVKAQAETADLPYILPGPADSWAGGVPHTLRFRLGVRSDRRLVLDLWAVETHDELPPVLTIGLNQAVVAVVHTRRGTGRPPPHRERGVRSHYRVTVPASAGGAAPESTLSITTTSGSWVMWERIRLTERLPTLALGHLGRTGPPPLLPATLLGASLAALVVDALARARRHLPSDGMPARSGAVVGFPAGLLLLLLGWGTAVPDTGGVVARVPRWVWVASPWLLLALPPALARLRACRARIAGDIARSPAAAPGPLSLSELAGAGLAYLALTLLLTWPGAARFTTHFMADGGDGLQNVWNLWWVKTAVLQGRWPWWTDRLFAPDGVSLYFHTLAFTNGLLSLPFQLLFPLTVSHNVVILATFVLSGVAVYGFVRFWVADATAAFLAGSLFTFSPFHFAHGIGHLQLMPIFWLPLYGWALLRACRTGAPRHAVVAGVVLVGVLLTDYYFTLDCLLVTGLIAVWRRAWRMVGIAGLTAAVLALPFAVPMAGVMLTTPLVGAHDATQASADLLSWFVPGPASAWASFSAPVWRQFRINFPSESGMYLGYVPLGILALSACAGIPRVAPLALGAALFWLLALGPWLHIAGWISPVPLPYRLLELIPFMNLSGVPARFGVMVYLCLALAVGVGVATLWRHRTRRQRWAIFLALLAALLLDYAPQPYHTERYAIPLFYAELARQPDEGESLMDLPPHPHWHFPLGMVYQTVHGRRLVGGYVARFPRPQYEAFYAHPVIRFLAGSVGCSEGLRRDMLNRLSHDRVRWIIVRNAEHRALGECLEVQPAARDGLIVFGPLW